MLNTLRTALRLKPTLKLLCLSLALVGFSGHASPTKVIELFTSQGCSSCPPADELAAKLSKDPNYLVLTLSVDYWDYLGWKDTNAQPAFTERQYHYAKARGDGSVYTPQVVINGGRHVVGSDERRILSHSSTPFAVDVTLTQVDQDFLIHVEQQLAQPKADILLMPFNKKSRVVIKRGENRNRTVDYTNVVIGVEKLGEWSGEASSYTLKRNAIAKADGFAVVLQTYVGNKPKQIIGASSWISPNTQ